MTTLSVQLSEISHFLQLRQPVVARVAVSRILKEFRVVSQLPHPGFMREMLMEAEQFLPRDARCARIVIDEAKEYLELLSFDIARGRHVFPGSQAQDRKARLALRMEQWAKRASDGHALRELRYKSASMWEQHKQE
jgi:hypothetical protein